MDADRLFLATLADLTRRLSEGSTEYDVLMTSPLLRKLLLDGGASLVDQVNRSRRLKLGFWIGLESEFERMTLSLGPAFWVLADGLDPETRLVHGPSAVVTRDAFLSRRALVANSVEYSVRDVIAGTANAMGGVHLDRGKTDEQRLLAEVNAQLQVGGMGAAVRALPAIGRVVRRALDPLREAVSQG